MVTRKATRFPSMATKPTKKNSPLPLDLAPYSGRWVAIVRGCITGVGLTEPEARRASKFQRPKEDPVVVFVPAVLTKNE
jgi:hypothetical protein